MFTMSGPGNTWRSPTVITALRCLAGTTPCVQKHWCVGILSCVYCRSFAVFCRVFLDDGYEVCHVCISILLPCVSFLLCFFCTRSVEIVSVSRLRDALQLLAHTAALHFSVGHLCTSRVRKYNAVDENYDDRDGHEYISSKGANNTITS
jgi:hypothetical protein